MFTGDLTSEQGKQDYENYIMNNVRNEINSYTKQTQSNAIIGVNSFSSNNVIPTGIILPFGGGPGVTPNPGTIQDVPTGWLLCSGAAASRTAYSALFAIIGTTYGVGDGSTTFNVPDLRGRIAAGKDNMGGTTASRLTSGGSGITGTTLGSAGGTETHTLTEAQMPSHSHGVYVWPDYATPYGSWLRSLVQSGNYGQQNQGSTDARGSSQAHLNTQPTIIINYIIKG